MDFYQVLFARKFGICSGFYEAQFGRKLGGYKWISTDYEDIISVTNAQGKVRSLKINLEPIQDLHGYDKPWSGGAGKNLCDDATIEVGYYTDSGEHSLSSDFRTSALIPASPNTTYSTSIFAKDTKSRIGGLVATCWDSSENVLGQYTTSPLTTPSNTAYIRVRNFNSASSYITSNNFLYQLEKGSSYTDYEPYSNICPISGHTEVDTHRTGVNVWDEEVESGGIYNDTGIEFASDSFYRCKGYIPIKPNTNYYFKCSDHAISANKTTRAIFYDSDKAVISSPSGSVQSRAITSPNNARYMRFFVNESVNGFDNTSSINYPSTDHDYHAYEGATYTTPLGQTVYGGVLDVVSGELAVDRAMVDLGTLNWRYDSGGYFQAVFSDDAKHYTSSETANAICSSYAVTSVLDATSRNGSFGIYYYASGGKNYIRVHDEAYTDATAFKTAMSGVQLCYELATPTTYQLTPQEVKLLLGNNTIWSDGGKIRIVYKGK